MSKVITGGEAEACQSWLLPEMPQGKSQGLLTVGQMEATQNQAHQEGFEQGLKEGLAAAAAEIKAQKQQLNALLKALVDPLATLDEEIEKQLVHLSMAVARQLVRRELKADPDQIIGVVKEALAVLPVTSNHVQLVLHPDDAKLVRSALPIEEAEQKIQIVDDPVQTPGGCRVLTNTSLIDATVESRLNAVIANVLGGERHSDSHE